MNDIESYPVLMKVSEVAELLRKGKNFVLADIHAGRLNAVRFSKKTFRIPRDEVVQLYLYPKKKVVSP